MLAKLDEGVRNLIEEALAAQVTRDGKVAADAGIDAHELRELQDEARSETKSLV